MDRTLIDRYAEGPTLLGNAVQGLTRDDLTAFPVPGAWSIHQVIVHVLDSDLIATDRMRRVVAEELPLLIGYDETRAAAALFYHDEPLEEVLELFARNRARTARVLRKLPDAAFDRAGIHNERGRVTLRDLVETYVEHVDHHLRFVAEKRARLGKPLRG